MSLNFLIKMNKKIVNWGISRMVSPQLLSNPCTDKHRDDLRMNPRKTKTNRHSTCASLKGYSGAWSTCQSRRSWVLWICPTSRIVEISTGWVIRWSRIMKQLKVRNIIVIRQRISPRTIILSLYRTLPSKITYICPNLWLRFKAQIILMDTRRSKWSNNFRCSTYLLEVSIKYKLIPRKQTRL